MKLLFNIFLNIILYFFQSTVAFCQIQDSLPTPTALTGITVVCPAIPTSYSVPHVNNAIAHWQVIGGLVSGNFLTGDSIEVLFNPTLPTYTVKVWYEGATCSSNILSTAITRYTPTIVIKDGNNNTTNTTECGSSLQTYTATNINADVYIWTVVPSTAGSIQSGQNTTSVTILWNQSVAAFANVKLVAKKCGSDYVKLFKVTVVNTVAVNIVAPASICALTTVSPSFTLASGTSFTSVSWDFGDGSPAVVSTSNTAPPYMYSNMITANTTYNITATVTNPNGCIMPAVKSVPIIVSPAPYFDFIPNYELKYLYLCNPNAGDINYQTVINLQSGFGFTYTIQWYKGLTAISAAAGGNNAIFNYGTAYLSYGIGDYYAVVTNNFGCSKTTLPTYVRYNCNPGPGGTVVPGDPNNGGVYCPTTCPIDFAIIETCQGIVANPTSLGCATTNQRWKLTSGIWPPGVQVPVNTPSSFEANNFEPGVYSLDFAADYSACNTTLSNSVRKSFLIPYKADLKYNVACATNGYNVKLIDFSVYYPTVPIQNFSFSYNNDASWYPATVAGNMHQLVLPNMQPGSYQIGIKISSTGHAECTKFITLVLPALPNAAFTFDNNTCAGTAMQFHATDQTPGLQYDWLFGDGTHNLQRDPVKTIVGGSSSATMLTVTNKWGCAATYTFSPNYVANGLGGLLTIVPATVCQGESQLIQYNQINTLYPATNFVWYKNTNTQFPFTSAIVATTSIPQLSVAQAGQYFVYVSDANGCINYANGSITVNPIALPAAPIISGNATQCYPGSYNIDVSVPANNLVVYDWTLNNVPQPQWHNQNAVSSPPIFGVGNYTFGCTAQTLANNGGCTSAASSFTTMVIDQPVIPILSVVNVSCDPYLFEVSVSNPQAGIDYYWCNGAIGTSTQMTHGGAIQVRAQSINCSVTSQRDLPEDLSNFEWYFPKGCYTFCKEGFDSFVTNPLYPFSNWAWLQDGSPIATGTDEVGDFNQLSSEHNYQLEVQNYYCKKTFGDFSINLQSCDRCSFAIKKYETKAVFIKEKCVFRVNMYIYNPSLVPLACLFSAPAGEGYFVSNNIVLLSGTNQYQILFYPTNGFTQGNVTCLMEATVDGTICRSKFDLKFENGCTKGTKDGVNTEFNNVLTDNLLIVAPNPTNNFTDIIYSYAHESSKKTIEVSDLVGRVLVTITLTDQSGRQELDCSALASGTYTIVMKEDDVVVKSTKLIKQD